MDLNSISLPAAILSELYGDTLVDTGDTTAKSPPITEPVAESKPANGGNWLGNNQKNILVLVRYSEFTHLPDKQLGFLTAMVAACKLGIGDVAILNLDNYPVADYKELIKQFKSKIVLLFDIEPAALGLPMNFPQFQIQPFANTSFLYAPSLELLEEDKILKSKLWVSLRRLFNI